MFKLVTLLFCLFSGTASLLLAVDFFLLAVSGESFLGSAPILFFVMEFVCGSKLAKANQVFFSFADMDVIMTTCKFSSEQYSPDKDKVVNNIQVQATPPKAVWGQNAGVASGGAATLRPIRGFQVGVGTALSLLQRWIL